MKFGWIAGRDRQNGLFKVGARRNCIELRSSDFGQDRTEKNMRQGKEVVCDSAKKVVVAARNMRKLVAAINMMTTIVAIVMWFLCQKINIQWSISWLFSFSIWSLVQSYLITNIWLFSRCSQYPTYSKLQV